MYGGSAFSSQRVKSDAWLFARHSAANVDANGNGSGGSAGIAEKLHPEAVYTGQEDHVIIMPKMKTHKAIAKRFKITGKGELRRLKGRRSHLRRRKSKRVRRSLDKDQPLANVDRNRVRRLLGLRNPKFCTARKEVT